MWVTDETRAARGYIISRELFVITILKFTYYTVSEERESNESEVWFVAVERFDDSQNH